MRIVKQAVGAAAALVMALAGTAAGAQGFPTKPVRIVVPFGAGGVADITSRIVAQKLGERLGQQVLVENKPSAGGILASETVAKADPDGHTLLFITNGTAVSVSLFKSLPFDPVKDFAPISTIGFFDLLVVTGAEAKLGTLAEVIAQAKREPGKLNIGTINPGGTQHLAAELFKSMAGIDVQIVPFKRTPDVITALRANDVQIAFEFLAPTTPQIKAGALKPLGVSGKTRFATLPDVPTIAEAGVPGYEATSWNGLAAPVATPAPVVAQLNKEVNTVMALPDVKQRLQELGIEARGSTPKALQDQLVADIAKWKAVVERANIPKQ